MSISEKFIDQIVGLCFLASEKINNSFFYKHKQQTMYVPNKSIEIFREGSFHARENPVSKRSLKCQQFGEKLTNCVLSNNLNILNHQNVRDTCETDQWRSNCNGQWRRFYIEEIYRKKMNKDLYNQRDMDIYMKHKNNIYHNSFLPDQ